MEMLATDLLVRKHPTTCSNMAFARFKLNKANASTKLAPFQKRPSWEELALKITHLFNVPQEHVGVVYVDDNRNIVSLNSEEDLFLQLPSL
jgi:hypothetical protein